ncbi:MAG: hypothetical protein U0002_22530 [Thermoanaerobaculia bacterium]
MDSIRQPRADRGSATGAIYSASALASFATGNGTTETRNFDARYSPTEVKPTAGATTSARLALRHRQGGKPARRS